MKITAKSWAKYRDGLAKISSKAAAEMESYAAKYGYEINDAFLNYAFSLSETYGEAAGALACEMYDSVAASYGYMGAAGYIPPAEMAPTATFSEVAKAVNGAAKQSETQIPGAVGRLVKQVGADTILENADRDSAEVAWIPSGDTCAFCLTLASQGWHKEGYKGHADHIHEHCNCEFAVRFGTDLDIAGYDPDAYKKMYDNAPGFDSKAKINAMRREAYAKNKDAINAQKRDAYERRKLEDADEIKV